MKGKITLLLLLLFMSSSVAMAINKKKMSATTQRLVQTHRARLKVAPASEGATVRAFIHIADAGVKADLEQLGVAIDSDFDEFVTARIPLSRLNDVLALDGVTYVNAEQNMQPSCDSARIATKSIDVVCNTALAQAAGITQAYTGKGIVAGVIDGGIDFQHIAFRDSKDNCRIKRAYFNGVFSDRPDTLVNADSQESGHGTHTASILGGSPVMFDRTNYTVSHTDDLQNPSCVGMAPDVDFFLCETERLGNVEVVNCMKAIADYAYKEGKPCVISCSFGITVGPHDGTGELPSVIRKLTQRKDCIVTMSSSNSAADKIYAYKEVGTGDSLNLIFLNNINEEHTYCKENSAIDEDVAAYMGVFARQPNTQFTVQSHIYRVDTIGPARDTLVFVYDSPIYDFDSEYSLNEADKKEYAKYFNGYCNVEMAYDSNNDKYYSYIRPVLFDEKSGNFFREDIGYSKYGMMITVRPKDPDDRLFVDAWAGPYAMFADNGIFHTDIAEYGVTTPSPDCTVSTEVTCDRAIGVGSYNTRDVVVYPTAAYRYLSLPVGDISYFSSYMTKEAGPLSGTENARALPDIAAPGAMVLAAVHPEMLRIEPDNIAIPDPKNPYTYMPGTSMACPAAAGVVALWLQAAKANGLSLDVDDIRTILEKSADKDEFTTDEDGNAVAGFGPNGKINAVKGLVEVLKMAAEVSSVERTNADAKAVKSVRYVNLNGQVGAQPFAGEVNLKVTRYDDDSERVEKVLR